MAKRELIQRTMASYWECRLQKPHTVLVPTSQHQQAHSSSERHLALRQLSTVGMSTQAFVVHETTFCSDLDSRQGQWHGYGEEGLLERFHS